MFPTLIYLFSVASDAPPWNTKKVILFFSTLIGRHLKTSHDVPRGFVDIDKHVLLKDGIHKKKNTSNAFAQVDTWGPICDWITEPTIKGKANMCYSDTFLYAPTSCRIRSMQFISMK